MNLSLGSLLIIWITGDTQKYVAEVLQEKPLYLKVTENGPFNCLKPGDYIIDENLSEKAQGTELQQQELLQEMVTRGTPLASGLASVGVTDDTIHELFPSK